MNYIVHLTFHPTEDDATKEAFRQWTERHEIEACWYTAEHLDICTMETDCKVNWLVARKRFENNVTGYSIEEI
jgi:hypothetical protein